MSKNRVSPKEPRQPNETSLEAMKSPEENNYFLLVWIGRHWLVWHLDDGRQAVSDSRAEVEEFRKQFMQKHPKGYSKLVIGSEVRG